jgi:hypothetical protein
MGAGGRRSPNPRSRAAFAAVTLLDLPRAVTLLLLSLCAASGAAAADCPHARPLADSQIVVGDAWFLHAGADRVLLACGGGNVSLWLHLGCNNEDEPVGVVRCNIHFSSVLHALGGQLYVRARGDGVLHTPLHDEWAVRRKEEWPPAADDEAVSHRSSERRSLLPALPPPRLTDGRVLSDVESLPPPLKPSAADQTVSTLDALEAGLSISSAVSLHVVGRLPTSSDSCAPRRRAPSRTCARTSPSARSASA